jgi:Protein of unknown function (DUF3500)
MSSHLPSATDRRAFLKQAGAVALAAAGSPLLGAVPTAPTKTPETLVKLLYDSLNDQQKSMVCFPWNHVDKTRGLLRTRLENNWRITDPLIKGTFYTADQQDLIRKIFEGMTSPGWHERFDKQLRDDIGGFGQNQSLAIFGRPGADKFEFVLTSRHMTLRCDGHSAEHVALGGPILYAHEGEDLYEKPHHPSNVFWHQAKAANKLYDMFDGTQRKQALVINGMPSEELVGFRGPQGKFDGIAVKSFSADQKDHLQSVLKLLLEPFRQSDQDDVVRCLKVQGGLDACHLAFYKEGDLGEDGVWDNWRLEGPSFVWYFRGNPHVHVWVHVANSPAVKLNSYQDSIGV